MIREFSRFEPNTRRNNPIINDGHNDHFTNNENDVYKGDEDDVYKGEDNKGDVYSGDKDDGHTSVGDDKYMVMEIAVITRTTMKNMKNLWNAMNMKFFFGKSYATFACHVSHL